MVLFEPLIVLLVKLAELATGRHRLLTEEVDQVRDQRPHFLFLVEHGHDKADEFVRVLGDWLGLLVHDRVEQFGQARLLERRLQTCHGVKSDTHGPDITPLVVALLLDDFG